MGLKKEKSRTENQKVPDLPFDFDISHEFIEEQKKMKLVRPKKKLVRYTKSKREQRRRDIFLLHFERGFPAIKIAELLQIDKNIINNDIRLIYSDLGIEWSRIDHVAYFAGQILRLQTQRNRLLSYLENERDLKKKLAVERLVVDIDFKLAVMVSKAEFSAQSFWEAVYKKINQQANEKRVPWRVTSLFELIRISVKTRRKFDTLLQDIRRS